MPLASGAEEDIQAKESTMEESMPRALFVLALTMTFALPTASRAQDPNLK